MGLDLMGLERFPRMAKLDTAKPFLNTDFAIVSSREEKAAEKRWNIDSDADKRAAELVRSGHGAIDNARTFTGPG
jgi:hypothetical protein